MLRRQCTDFALAPGTRLGAYGIVSVVGSGGTGEVFRAPRFVLFTLITSGSIDNASIAILDLNAAALAVADVKSLR
jgi:hypothetical protein